MNLDGRRLSEDERMRLLREEEDALGIQPWEYVSNEIIAHRLQMHTPSPTSPDGQSAASKATTPDDGSVWADGSLAGLAR